MKKCIISLIQGNYYKEIGKITIPSFVKYSKKCNADLKFFECNPENHYSDNTLVKSQLWKKTTEYEQVLFIDIDSVISNFAPNIFNLYNKDDFVVCSGGTWNRTNPWSLIQFKTHEKYNVFPDYTINTSLMLFNKSHFKVFEKPLFYENDKIENPNINQEYINICLKKYSINYKFFHNSWQRIDYHTPFNSFHAIGNPKKHNKIELCKKAIIQNNLKSFL